ncbi:MAG: hydrogenase maturation protease [Bacteroidales bacterium]|nr:hydrogenase maturation protease [Bacteroidales bacterium]
MNAPKTTLILGIGNDILSDDGIGIRLVNDLKVQLDEDTLQFDTLNVGGLEIVEQIQPYNKVIIIDAIKTKQGVPGEVMHLTPEIFKQTSHISSFHDISFLTAIKFGHKIGMNIPEQIDIIAIEIVEDMVFSSQLSPIIQKRYKRILKEVVKITKTVLAKTDNNTRLQYSNYKVVS